MFLGVNIDHVAVLREARKVDDPNLLEAALIASKYADQITIHTREDRRHANENDLAELLRYAKIPINLECSVAEEMIKMACSMRPARVTLVPEKRAELTTEGGLNLKLDKLEEAIKRLQRVGIEVSLFIDANEEDISRAKLLNTDFIELHTGHFANIYNALYSNILKTPYALKELDKSKAGLKKDLEDELLRLKNSAQLAKSLNLGVAAGHGLNYKNVKLITQIKEITELNIGQSIIARAVFVGLEKAILQMRALIDEA